MAPTKSYRAEQKAVVWALGDLLVAEITRSIEEETERRLREERASKPPVADEDDGPARIAADLTRMAREVERFRSAWPVPPSCSGPLAAKLLIEAKKLATMTEKFSGKLEWFMEHHGRELGDNFDAVRGTLVGFIRWAPQYRDEIARDVEEFGRRFEADLAADAERQQQIAAEWSSVDGDIAK